MDNVGRHGQLHTFLIGRYLVSFGVCRNATKFVTHPIRYYVKFSFRNKLTFATPTNGNKFRKKKKDTDLNTTNE